MEENASSLEQGEKMTEREFLEEQIDKLRKIKKEISYKVFKEPFILDRLQDVIDNMQKRAQSVGSS